MNKFNFLIFFIVAVLSFGLVNSSIAQTSLQNISSINVDDLSDQQVIQLIQQAQKAGLSDADLLQQAQSRGMSASQAQKLQARIKEVKAKNSAPAKNSADTSATTGRQLNYKPDTTDTAAYSHKDLFEVLKIVHLNPTLSWLRL
jgi:hypothetical protein